MIFKKSSLYAADNSGARVVSCIGFLENKSYKNVARQASHIVVSVKRFIPNKKVRKGAVFHAVIIQTFSRCNSGRMFGHVVSWSSNRMVLMKRNDFVPISSRVTHFVSFALRATNFSRVLSLSLGVL